MQKMMQHCMSKHARKRLLERYSISITKKQGNIIAASICQNLRKVKVISRSNQRNNAFQTSLELLHESGIIEVPLLFTVGGDGLIIILTALPKNFLTKS